MAELTATDTSAHSCCAPERQATCCEPSAKADCCGHDEGCGCDAGTPDIRETARERFRPAELADAEPPS
jgi:arsenite methyltransferase